MQGAGLREETSVTSEGEYTDQGFPCQEGEWRVVWSHAQVVKLVYTRGLGPRAARRGGSSPLLGTSSFRGHRSREASLDPKHSCSFASLNPRHVFGTPCIINKPPPQSGGG